MINYIKTNSKNSHFLQLVALLDADLKIRDGEDHEFYAQFNKTVNLNHVIVAYNDEQPVGCGALREFDKETMEVKRMYVLPERRGEGIASTILQKLEQWAAELNYKKCILETGKNQPEAINLYAKSKYNRIPNYGNYQHVENSVCFEKKLTQ